MITYSKEAQESYINNIHKLQKELGKIPSALISHTDIVWLVHALGDLEKVVAKEHN